MRIEHDPTTSIAKKKNKKKNEDTKTKSLVYSLLQNKPDVIMVSTPDKLYGIAEEDKT